MAVEFPARSLPFGVCSLPLCSTADDADARLEATADVIEIRVRKSFMGCNASGTPSVNADKIRLTSWPNQPAEATPTKRPPDPPSPSSGAPQLQAFGSKKSMNATNVHATAACLIAGLMCVLSGCITPVPKAIGKIEFRGAEIPLFRDVRYEMAVAPVYPPEAKQKGIKGVGVLRVVVDESGKAVEFTVVESTPTAEFGRAVLEAARSWRYFPVTQANGQSIVYALEIAVKFPIPPAPEFRPMTNERNDYPSYERADRR